MDSMVDCSTLVSKEKWSRSSSVCVMKDRKAQDTDLIPNRKPRSISPNTETNTGGATSREVINLKIKRFVGVVLQTLVKTLSSRGKLGENLESILVDFLTRQTHKDLAQLLEGLSNTQATLKQLMEHPTRDRNFLKLLELGLVWPFQSVTSKGFYFRKLFDCISSTTPNSDKMCALSRILWGLRSEIGQAGLEVVEFFFKTALYALGSDKRKILSNSIRMIGLLTAHVPENILLRIWAIEQTGSGRDTLQSILVEFSRLLAHESPKYSWNVSCALSIIFKRFQFFKSGQPTNPYLGRLYKGLQDMLPQVAKNFIKSGNVKLKLHSLSLLAETPGALDYVELPLLVECIQFARDLNNDTWIDTVSPEYSDVKFLQQLKSRSTDLVVDLLPVLETRGAIWTDYQPALGCLTAILTQLKHELITTCRVALEDVDEDTGKLIPKARILVQSPSPTTIK